MSVCRFILLIFDLYILSIVIDLCALAYLSSSRA